MKRLRLRPGKDKLFVGDAQRRLRRLASNQAHCCVTSPPYYGLRDYGHKEQIGSEKEADDYVRRLVLVFREVRRVLRDDGTLWLNLGDTWLKKNLLGIPWRVALALQKDGWVLRQDVVWQKPNVMPEPVKDRCVHSHEFFFLFSKNLRYHFDFEAIREPSVQPDRKRSDRFGGNKHTGKTTMHSDGSVFTGSKMRTKRSVWAVNTVPYKGAHFAVFPPKLIEPCILASCPPGGVVLDPFMGAGTTALVARQNGRHWLGIELNPDYANLIEERVACAKASVVPPWAKS